MLVHKVRSIAREITARGRSYEQAATLRRHVKAKYQPSSSLDLPTVCLDVTPRRFDEHHVRGRTTPLQP